VLAHRPDSRSERALFWRHARGKAPLGASSRCGIGKKELRMSRGNREKKKPKADKNKAKVDVATTPFGAASNAGKPAHKRE